MHFSDHHRLHGASNINTSLQAMSLRGQHSRSYGFVDAQCMCPADLEPAWDLSHHLHLLKTSRARDTDVLVTVLRAPLWPESSSRARSLAACALSAASRCMRLRLSVEVRLASRDALRRLLWKEKRLRARGRARHTDQWATVKAHRPLNMRIIR